MLIIREEMQQQVSLRRRGTHASQDRDLCHKFMGSEVRPANKRHGQPGVFRYLTFLARILIFF